MRKYLTAAAVLATAAVFTAVAFAVTTIQEIVVKVDPAVGGKKKNPKKHKLDVTILTIDSGGSNKPAPGKTTIVRFPKEFEFHPELFPTCDKADIEKKSAKEAREACKNAIVGGGSATVVSGIAALDPIPATVTAFNGKNKTLYLHADAAKANNQSVLVGVLQKSTDPAYGQQLNVTIPPLPTLPGLPNASITTFRTIVQRTGKGYRKPARRSGPRRKVSMGYAESIGCKAGKWTFAVESLFEDGTKASDTVDVNCS